MPQPKQLLITGFEPFGDFVTNPSFDALPIMLEQAYQLSNQVAIVRLPVSYGDASTELCRAIAEHQPELLLCLGIHGGKDTGNRRRNAFYIERVASNCDDARIPDNNGRQPERRAINVGKPLDSGLQSTIDPEPLIDALQEAGFEAELSWDAGRYLCNHVFYCACWEAEKRVGDALRVGFVHVPPPLRTDENETTTPFGDLVSYAHAYRAMADALLTHV